MKIGLCCCEEVGPCSVRKIDPDGEEVWRYLGQKLPTNKLRVDTVHEKVYIIGGVGTTDGSMIERLDFATPSPPDWYQAVTPGGSAGNVSQLAVAPNDAGLYHISANFFIRKLNLSGTQQWSAMNGTLKLEAADGSYLYNDDGTFLNRTNTTTGVVTWSSTAFLGNTASIAIDSANDVWGGYANLIIRQLDAATGVLGTTAGIAVTDMDVLQTMVIDPSVDQFWHAGRNTANTMWYLAKGDNSGGVNWEVAYAPPTFGGNARCAYDASGAGFLSTNSIVRKYDSTGTFQWSFDHGARINWIACDDQDYLYLCGAASTL